MKIIDCEQGTDSWYQARLGIPTASGGDQIVTPKTMKPSASQGPYMAKLLAEWLLGASLDQAATPFMDRGKEMEPSACDWYGFTRDVDAQRVGFCLHDAMSAGCSPDRLVDDDGGLEVKCLSPAQHMAVWLAHEQGKDVAADHRVQVQWNLWITGRRWWDLLYYHPSLPKVCVRVERDETFIESLAACVADFADRLDDAKRQLADVKAENDRAREAARAAASSHPFDYAVA